MKKLSYFAIAFAFTALVACKGKSADDTEAVSGQDTTATTVETGASEQINNAAEVDAVLNQSSDDELFGTDVDDAAVENATKK